jgi:hypothetical protein
MSGGKRVGYNSLRYQDVADLKQIIDNPIFITGNSSLQDQEIARNMWCLSIDPDVIKTIAVNDLVDFVSSLLNKRTQQIIDAGVIHPAIFYMWFDEMAAQLRFNIISDFGKKLPFGCQLDIVDSPQPILEDFLASHYHADIPWSELEELHDDLDEDDEKSFISRVFVRQLKNNNL